jgi:hypothetical protein
MEDLTGRQDPSSDHGNKPKSLDIVPHKDPKQLIIIRAREDAVTDPELTDGARNLFTFLLDLANNPYVNNGRPGQIAISNTQLRERLSRSARGIYGWTEELIVQRHVWMSKLPRPNMHAMNVFHITAQQPKRDIRQELPEDGMWGNGYRRPDQGMPLGARGGTCTKRHYLFDRFGKPLFAQVPANAAATRTKYTSLPQNLREGPAQNDTCHPQNLREDPAQNDTRLPQNLRVPPAQKDTTPPQIPSVLRESQIQIKRGTETSLSCLTAEGGANAVPTQPFSGSSALRKRVETENSFLEELTRTLAKYNPKQAEKEMINWGARWRLRYREDVNKSWRVLSELAVMIREGKITRNAGAAADDIWRRFA